MAWSTMADVPNPIFDANGDPYSGAVLKAYDPGTTDVTSIAIDASGSSPQTSITANAEGKWEVSSNEVIPHINKKHKWAIFANSTDAAANTPAYMGPFDNVEVSASTVNLFYAENYDDFAAAVTAAAGAELVISTNMVIASNITVTGLTLRFIQGGNLDPNTSITVTLNCPIIAGNYEIFDSTAAGIIAGTIEGMAVLPEWFGAVFDGSTDDSAEIQDAFDFNDSRGGGAVLWPAANAVTSLLLRPGDNTTIIGQGYASVLSADGSTDYYQQWGTDITTNGLISIYKKLGVTVKDIRIDGKSSTKADARVHGMHLQEATDFTIDNVWIQNIPSDGSGLAAGGDGIVIQDADLTDNPCERGVISNFHIENTLRQGIALTFCDVVEISNGDIKGAGKEGIDIEPNASDSIKNLTISNVNIDTCNFGIAVSGAGPITDVSVTGGTIKDCIEGGLVITPSSGGTKPDRVSICGTVLRNNNTNNTAEASCEGAISIRANNVTVSGVISTGGGTCGVRCWDSDNITLNGNTFSLHRYSGIWIDAARGTSSTSVKNITITNNTCIDNGQQGSGTHYGIKLEDASLKLIENLVLDNNICTNSAGSTQTYGLGHVGASSDQNSWVVGDNYLAGNATGQWNGTFEEFEWKSMTIASGAIVFPRPGSRRPVKIKLAGEGATTDTLDSVTGALDGDQMILRNSQGSYTITLNDASAAGNLRSGGATQALDTSRDVGYYVYSADDAEWLMIGGFTSNA